MDTPTSQDLPTSGRMLDNAHLLPVRIYYEDTDFTGIVYHANYLRFFERGRSDFLRTIGVHHDSLASEEAPSAFAVTRMEIDFKSPARIDDALLVKTRFTGMRGPRLFFHQRIERDETLICAADVTATAIHMDGRVKRPSPADIALWRQFESET